MNSECTLKMREKKREENNWRENKSNLVNEESLEELDNLRKQENLEGLEDEERRVEEQI